MITAGRLCLSKQAIELLNIIPSVLCHSWLVKN